MLHTCVRVFQSFSEEENHMQCSAMKHCIDVASNLQFAITLLQVICCNYFIASTEYATYCTSSSTAYKPLRWVDHNEKLPFTATCVKGLISNMFNILQENGPFHRIVIMLCSLLWGYLPLFRPRSENTSKCFYNSNLKKNQCKASRIPCAC